MTRKLRRTEKLTNVNTWSAYYLDFEPLTVTVQNYSNFPVYVHVGSSDRPSATNFTEGIPPLTSYVIYPGGATEYAIAVDNSSNPSQVFNLPVTIIFSQDGASSQTPLSYNFATQVASTYISKVSAIESASLIDFWELNESVGTTAIDSISAARNGTYVNSPALQAALFADSVNKAPAFVAASSQYVNIFTSSLAAAFNGQEGTAVLWVKLLASDWSSATAYTFLALQGATSFNEIVFRKSGASSLFAYRNAANSLQGSTVSVTTSNWVCCGLTWSLSNNRVRLYVNGSQLTADQTGLSTFGGSIASAYIGCYNGNQQMTQGNLAMCLLWTKELTATEMQSVGTAP